MHGNIGCTISHVVFNVPFSLFPLFSSLYLVVGEEFANIILHSKVSIGGKPYANLTKPIKTLRTAANLIHVINIIL